MYNSINKNISFRLFWLHKSCACYLGRGKLPIDGTLKTMLAYFAVYIYLVVQRSNRGTICCSVQ